MAGRLIRAGLLLAALAAGPVAALEFTPMTRGDARILMLEGKFERDDDARFRRMIAAEPYDEVWFDSGGGNVKAGQGIGRAMRANGLLGRVPADAKCASACVDAFLGAPVRFVDRPESIGVHMFSIFRSEPIQEAITEDVAAGNVGGVIRFMEEFGAEATARWIGYMMEMGVAPSLIAWTVEVPHLCIYWLSAEEMRHFNVVNTAGPPAPGFRPGNGRMAQAARGARCER